MKLIVCDVEGTIFKADFKIDGTDFNSTMWQPIANILGEAAIAEERETHKKWEKNEYLNYLDWVKDTVAIHKKYSLKKCDFETLISKTEYNTGVIEFFAKLDRKEWMPILISGGLQNLIHKAQKDLNIDFGFGACEYFFDNYGYLDHCNFQATDFKGKISFLDTVIKEYKINKMTDWIFVGDGKNDVEIARIAPLAFGINPHDKLKQLENLIEINSFMDIIPHMRDFKPKVKEEIKISKKQDVDNERTNQIIQLKLENKQLKEKLDKQKNKKEENKETIKKIEMYEYDYSSNPQIQLNDLLKNLKVVFLGLRKEYPSFRRLEKFDQLRLISGANNNFDDNKIMQADFIFIYKNCISHSAIAKALKNKKNTPCCFLLEHTNEQLIENAIANVLYRHLYGK